MSDHEDLVLTITHSEHPLKRTFRLLESSFLETLLSIEQLVGKCIDVPSRTDDTPSLLQFYFRTNTDLYQMILPSIQLSCQGFQTVGVLWVSLHKFFLKITVDLGDSRGLRAISSPIGRPFSALGVARRSRGWSSFEPASRSSASPTQRRLSGLRRDDATSREGSMRESEQRRKRSVHHHEGRRNAILANGIRSRGKRSKERHRNEERKRFRAVAFRDSLAQRLEAAFRHWKKALRAGACFVHCLAHEVRISGFFACPVAGGQDSFPLARQRQALGREGADGRLEGEVRPMAEVRVGGVWKCHEHVS
jgi:hypothetical protein